MLTVLRIFGTPLITTAIPDSTSLNASLRPIIEARRKKLAAPDATNGVWRSGQGGMEWDDTPAASLTRDALALARQHTVDVAAPAGRERFDWQCVVEAIVIPPGQPRPARYSAAAFWTSLYCVDDGYDGAEGPLGGEIEFEDPRAPLVAMEAPNLRLAPEHATSDPDCVRLRPVVGQMLMFPGWLRRSHTPNLGKNAQTFLTLDLIALPRD